MQEEFIVHENTTSLPTIHVISDSVGLTAQDGTRRGRPVRGDEPQHRGTVPRALRRTDPHLDQRAHGAARQPRRCARAHLLHACRRRPAPRAYRIRRHEAQRHGRRPAHRAIGSIAKLSGQVPSKRPGGLHVADQHYFRRIEPSSSPSPTTDGRNPQEMTQADIVLLACRAHRKRPRASIWRSRVTRFPTFRSIRPPNRRKRCSKWTARACSADDNA